MTLEEYEALMAQIRDGQGSGLLSPNPEPSPSKPKRRRKSKYQAELSRQLKKLTRKHPRTKVTKLMKRAHAATKKAIKK